VKSRGWVARFPRSRVSGVRSSAEEVPSDSLLLATISPRIPVSTVGMRQCCTSRRQKSALGRRWQVGTTDRPRLSARSSTIPPCRLAPSGNRNNATTLILLRFLSFARRHNPPQQPQRPDGATVRSEGRSGAGLGEHIRRRSHFGLGPARLARSNPTRRASIKRQSPECPRSPSPRPAPGQAPFRRGFWRVSAAPGEPRNP
jgi:hypothetical protein